MSDNSKKAEISRREYLAALGQYSAVAAGVLAGGGVSWLVSGCGDSPATTLPGNLPGGNSGPFRVSAGGFVTTGTAQGYAWTAAAPGSSISPKDFSASAAPPLCAHGSVAPTEDYSGWAMLGINVNQQQGANSPDNPWTPTGTGLLINVENVAGSELRVQLTGTNGETDASERWCAELLANGSTVFIPWSAFNTSCWDGTGAPYAMQPIRAISIIVPGGATTEVAFDFCLHSLDIAVDEGQTWVNEAWANATWANEAWANESWSNAVWSNAVWSNAVWSNYSDYNDHVNYWGNWMESW